MKYTIDDLLGIIEKLRAEDGCPWDREQTHDSIKYCLIEEAYETYEAIENGDDKAMADELGDVLLQVVFHSQIAKEADKFNFLDITDNICSKMIRRHPHVFGNIHIDNSAQVIVNWDSIKREEKNLTSVTEGLNDVCTALPSLVRANKIQSKAAKAGFGKMNISETLNKIDAEVSELKKAVEHGQDVEDRLGELLFSVANVARVAGVNAEEALMKANAEFIRNFSIAETSGSAQLVD